MSVTDEIKSRIDIVSYVQRFVPGLKKAGRNHKACCPFHTEKTPSFVVNPERQTWYCFGACAEGGDLFTFAQKLHGWDFKEALRELAHEAGVQLKAQTPEQKSRDDRVEHLRGIVASAAEFFQRQLQREAAAGVRRYLQEERGLHPETVREFLLGYAPDSWDFMLRSLRELGHSDDDIVEVGLAVRNENGRVYDRFRHRLMFPIHDDRGRAVGFGGRALRSEDAAKYMNSPQSAIFDKSRLLYGLDMGKPLIRETETVVIVEGYMDVIQAHQAGYANVVAQMGTAMTEAQLRLVAPRMAAKVVLALDTDQAGQNAARRSLEVARETLAKDFAGKLAIDIGILQVPAGKDPDDYLRESPDSWASLVERAQDVADFVIEMETTSLPANASVGARQSLAKSILPILRLSENNLYRQENIQKLARRLRIGEREMLAWAQEQAPTDRKGPHLDALPPELPPEYWDNEHALGATAAQELADSDEIKTAAGLSARPLKRAVEAYCLSVLLKNPNLLFLVNRKLRELAGDDEALLLGPLCDLGADDFTQSAHRALMVYLQDSMTQDDMEPMEYLGRVVDEALHTEFRALLTDEPEVISERIRGNYRVDLNDIFRRGFRGGRPGMNAQEELVCRALQLRLERLEQERVEMQYLQEEAYEGRDSDGQQLELINHKIMLSMRAKARINLAVS
ncbi:MAG: DNA primase [Chloroflexi bacterium]|nr:DNA primase [Chloroflexota bacterium]